jgi:hypothetical protein
MKATIKNAFTELHDASAFYHDNFCLFQFDGIDNQFKKGQESKPSLASIVSQAFAAEDRIPKGPLIDKTRLSRCGIA